MGRDEKGEVRKNFSSSPPSLSRGGDTRKKTSFNSAAPSSLCKCKVLSTALEASRTKSSRVWKSRKKGVRRNRETQRLSIQSEERSKSEVGGMGRSSRGGGVVVVGGEGFQFAGACLHA